MQHILPIAVIVLLSFIIGSFPSGVIISKMFFGFDIRNEGSGNMGSTNVFRVLGKKWGFIVQILDFAKGLLAVSLIGTILAHQIVDPVFYADNEYLIKIISGISSVLGHIYSVFVNFKGGKGINTAAGMLIGLAPIDMGVTFLCFWIVVGLSGYISLGSIVGAIVLPLSMIIRENIFGAQVPGYFTLIYFCIGLSILIIYKHKTNIVRIINGGESRFESLRVLKFGKKSSN